MKRPVGENGFTLVELLVVIAIIGILIAIPPDRSSSARGCPPDELHEPSKTRLAWLCTITGDPSELPAGVVWAGVVLGADAAIPSWLGGRGDPALDRAGQHRESV